MKPEETSLYAGVWVGGDGPLTAEMLLVGRDPGANEEKQGKPFVGPAGKMLQECVQEANLEWSELRRTNVIRCRLLGNRKSTDDELKEYLPWLLEEIDSMPNLRVIVALGNEAMKALTSKSGITDKRGEEVEWTHPNGRVFVLLPAFHPSYVLRKRSQRQILVKDLARARRIVRGEPLTNPASNVFFQTGGVRLEGRVSVDVETNEHDRPRLVGIANSPDSVYVVNANAEELSSCLGRNLTWLGHTLRRDRLWLRMIGFELTGPMEDTILKAHLLNENRSMGLKKLALELLDPALYWKYVEPKLRRPTTRGGIPYHELGEYCANDVAATLLVDDVLDKQLRAQPALENIYRRLSLPLSNVLLSMETHGALINERAVRDLEAKLSLDRLMLDGQLGNVVENWNSDVQVADYLYNTLGLIPPHKTKSGSRGSVDQEALMKLRWNHPIIPKIIERALVQKKIEIAQSIRKAIQPDGRIHMTYNETGTKTGRISCHDPNMQNIPTDSSFRSLVVAPPGRCLVGADYKTLEIGTGAWTFGAEDLMQAYLSGDVHTVTATALLGRPPKDKSERKKFGKTPNFGLEYQQGDDGFRDYAAKQGIDMTLDEARTMRARWHALYPGVREGWRRIGLQMRDNGGTVTAPSGRQRRLPEFLSNNSKLVNDAWRAGSNFPAQCTAAELTHIAAILAVPWLKAEFGADAILHVHDFLGFEVDLHFARDMAALLKHIMEDEVPAYFEESFGVKLPMPIWAEVGVGPDWGSLKALD